MTGYFLFANPSLLSGISRVLDIGSTMTEFNTCYYPEVADYYAVKSDWAFVGSDIAAAIKEYGRKRESES